MAAANSDHPRNHSWHHLFISHNLVASGRMISGSAPGIMGPTIGPLCSLIYTLVAIRVWLDPARDRPAGMRSAPMPEAEQKLRR
jgi:hypothetical protein